MARSISSRPGGEPQPPKKFVDPRELDAPESVEDVLQEAATSGEGVFQEAPRVVDMKQRLTEKAAARRFRIIKRVGIILGIVAAIAVTIWLLLFSPFTKVTPATVTITGATQWVPKEQVTSIATKNVNKSLLLVSAGDISGEILKLPGAKDVSISKGFPNSITIEVVEKVPTALLKDSQGALTVVDSKGSIIATVDEPIAGVPLIEVENTDRDLTGRAVKQALSVLSAVPTDLLATLVQVTAMTQDSVTTQTNQGVTIVWGNASHMDLKTAVVQKILADPAVLGTNTSIDVSAPERPMMKQ